MLLICLFAEAVTFLLNLILYQEPETSKPNHGGINVFFLWRFFVNEICSEVIELS